MRMAFVSAVWGMVLGGGAVVWGAQAGGTADAKKGPVCQVQACKEKGQTCPMKSEFDKKKGWICLFNGKDLTGWKPRPDRQGKNCWRVENGELINDLKPGEHGIDLITERKFEDFMLHIEFKVPKNGNSGVYLRGHIEVQVHDSFGQRPAMHTCGSLYSKKVADKVASKKAGEWQCFNITIRGNKVTVYHNGEKIIDAFDCPGPTGGELDGQNFGKPGPIMLQGDHTAVSYRNIWIKPLKGKNP